MATALGYLLDLDAPTGGGAVGDRLPFQYNPETVKWVIGSQWASLRVLGGSHPRQQWMSTGDWKRPIKITIVRENAAQPDFVRDRLDWLESLMLPDTDGNGVVIRGAHRLLLVLGDLIGVGASPGREVVLRGMEVQILAMDADLKPKIAEVDLDLQEYRTESLTSSMVRP